MSCAICGRSACIPSFHSFKEQEECEHGYYKINCQVCELELENAELRERIDELELKLDK